MPRNHADTVSGLARLQRELTPVASRTVDKSLMKAMTSLGDLATFAFHDKQNLSPFEADEASTIVGELLLAVISVADALDVDPIEAAHRKLEQLRSRSKRQPQQSQQLETSNEQQQQQQRTPKDQIVHQANSPRVDSPANFDEFVRMLSVVSRYSAEEFNKLGLLYVAPQDGVFKELIPDGQNVIVTHDRLPHFLRLVEKLSKHELPEAATAHPIVAPQHEHFVTQHIEVAAPPGYNAVAVEKLFSPTHFTYGLFSPHSKNTAFDVEYPAQRTPQAASSSASPGPTAPHDPTEFQNLLKRLESGEVSGPQVSALRLTFTVPAGDGKVCELTQGGSNIPVTAANVNEFLRLAKANQPIGRVRRLDSIKTLELGGAVNETKKEDRKKFSPTHGSKDLFAPIDDRRTFVVDYDCEADTLPVALRQNRTSAQRDSSPIVHNLPTAVHYQDYVRHGGGALFRKLIEQVEADPSTLTRLQVTWCTPASVAMNPTDDELSDGITDIIPDGRNTLVNIAQQKVFVETVKSRCRL